MDNSDEKPTDWVCRICHEPIDRTWDYHDPDADRLMDIELCKFCYADQIKDLISAREEYAETVSIEVSRLSFDSNAESASFLNALREVAIENAHHQREMYEGRHNICGNHEYTPDVNRAIVSLLRHSASNYDQILNGIPRETVDGFEPSPMDLEAPDDDPSIVIRNRVHAELAEIYPEVADLLLSAH